MSQNTAQGFTHEGIDVWYGCSKDDVIKVLEEPLSSADIWDADGLIYVPQADSMTELFRLTEGVRKKTSGTCGQPVKMSKDLEELGWRFEFTEQCGMPIRGAYFRQGDRRWIGWRDCTCNIGGVALGSVVFSEDYIRNVTSTDELQTGSFTFDICPGTLCKFPENNCCWPRDRFTGCADEETKTCCGSWVPACCIELATETAVSPLQSPQPAGPCPDPVRPQLQNATAGLVSFIEQARQAADDARAAAEQAEKVVVEEEKRLKERMIEIDKEAKAEKDELASLFDDKTEPPKSGGKTP